MAFSGPAEDRMAIRDLYDSYGDCSARGSADDWLTLWTDDGVWNTHIFSRTGKSELREQWDMLWQNFEKVAFLGNVGSIKVDGDTAACTSIAREIIQLKAGGVYKLAGYYRDQLVKVDGQWLFAQRDYEPLVEELPG